MENLNCRTFSSLKKRWIDQASLKKDVSHQEGDQSKAALYKTILASYSKSSINSNPLLHSISRETGSANGLQSRTSQKRRLRKNKRSKREFQRRSIVVAVRCHNHDHNPWRCCSWKFAGPRNCHVSSWGEWGPCRWSSPVSITAANLKRGSPNWKSFHLNSIF